MTTEEKLAALKKAWGYVEISTATRVATGWRIWLVKNYAGRPIPRMEGHKLPGNPHATRKIEYSSFTANEAVSRAYHSTFGQSKRERKRPKVKSDVSRATRNT